MCKTFNDCKGILGADLEEVDGERATEDSIRHGALNVTLDAQSDIQQLADAVLEALPQFNYHALLTRTQIQRPPNLEETGFQELPKSAREFSLSMEKSTARWTVRVQYFAAG